MTRPRRSPSADERKRDPERTREKILDAAVVEFGEHGFAGARISAIAARARVNQQLISYYFDGKEGLYRALQARWEVTSAGMNTPEMPFAGVVENFLRASVEQRSWTRLGEPRVCAKRRRKARLSTSCVARSMRAATRLSCFTA